MTTVRLMNVNSSSTAVFTEGTAHRRFGNDGTRLWSVTEVVVYSGPGGLHKLAIGQSRGRAMYSFVNSMSERLSR